METMRNVLKVPFANGRGYKPPKLSELYQHVMNKPAVTENLHSAQYDTQLLAEIVKNSNYIKGIMGLSAADDITSNASKKARTLII